MIEAFLKDANSGGKLLLETAEGSAWMWYDDDKEDWVVNGRCDSNEHGVAVYRASSLIDALMVLRQWAWGKDAALAHLG
jgi:hypothetical protein